MGGDSNQAVEKCVKNFGSGGRPAHLPREISFGTFPCRMWARRRAPESSRQAICAL